MTAVPGEDSRNVIPRWRPFGAAVRSGELSALIQDRPTRTLVTDVGEGLAAFDDNPGRFTAADVVALAVVGDVHSTDVMAAAEFIAKDEASTEPVRAMAEWLLAPDVAEIAESPPLPVFEIAHARTRAANVRAILRTEPRNAIRWVDLALAHLNLGASEKAEREMRMAVSMAPTNRYVLRSAARLFVLLGDPEKAKSLLSDTDLVLADPWMLATELAVSEVAGHSSKNLRRARAMVEKPQFAPWHLSELASQVATSELRHGSMRRAKRLMRSALVEPTDNALAQAEWASQHGLDRLENSALSQPLSFEAQARWHTQEGDYDEAVVQGLLWQADQPFAPEPAAFTSYIASVGAENYDAAIQAARQGLVASPDDTMLRNNLVFSLASAGRVAEAAAELTRISAPSDPSKAAVIIATRGLVSFRSGDVLDGRRNYRAALEIFVRLRQREHIALATEFWAREEILARTAMASAALREAAAAADGSDSQEVRLWLTRIVNLAKR